MKEYTSNIIKELIEYYPRLDYLEENLIKAVNEIVKRVQSGGKILVCGNGGSSSDSEHIVGELLKEFYIKRPIDQDFTKKYQELFKDESSRIEEGLQGGIPAISLVSQTGFLTAYGNDVSFDMAYAQQVYVYGNANDVFLGLSTSGNASNVFNAAKVAKAKDMLVISFTGQNGGKLKDVSDILLNSPSTETFMVQEHHLPLYHTICRAVEFEIFGDEK